jgi:hypothetical protein
LIGSINFLTHIFEQILFKGITIKISALILGKMTGIRSRAITTRIVYHNKKDFSMPGISRRLSKFTGRV